MTCTLQKTLLQCQKCGKPYTVPDSRGKRKYCPPCAKQQRGIWTKEAALKFKRSHTTQ